MIVVDTNVILYMLIPGEKTSGAEELFKKDADWVAPKLWLDEFVNVLCTYEQNEMISPVEARGILEDGMSLMNERDYEVPPELTLSVARRTGCSGYDSQFIGLAEQLGVKLATCDKRIIENCKDIAIPLN